MRQLVGSGSGFCLGVALSVGDFHSAGVASFAAGIGAAGYVFLWLTDNKIGLGLCRAIPLALVVGLLAFGLATKAQEKYSKGVYEQRIALIEAYPNEWPLTAVPPGSVADLAETTLRAQFSEREYHFSPFIINRNALDGLPLEYPTIMIRFPLNMQVKTPTLWRPMTDSGFHTFISYQLQPVLGKASGVNEVFTVRFPYEGQFPVRYEVEGTVRGIAVRREGVAMLALTKP